MDLICSDWLEEPELITYETPESQIIHEEMLINLKEAMKLLTDQERLVITYLFGLKEDKPLTIYQIARKMHISQNLIKRLYKSALKRLKDYL